LSLTGFPIPEKGVRWWGYHLWFNRDGHKQHREVVRGDLHDKHARQPFFPRLFSCLFINVIFNGNPKFENLVYHRVFNIKIIYHFD
jgi:hypothetical protein